MRKARLVVLACLLVATAVPAARNLTAWFSTRMPEVLDLDFARYYVSSRVGLQLGWSRLYDLDAQHEVSRVLGVPFSLPNVYTPAMSLFVAPWTLVSIEHGFLLWSALLLASLIMCWHLLAPGDAPARAVQLAILFIPYPVMLGVRHGQVVPVQMAVLALSYLLLRRGFELSAGAVLCVMVLKPQGLQLIPFALAAAGRLRAFVGWAIATTLVAVVILGVIGLDGAKSYAERLQWAQAHPFEMMVAWSYTLARRFQSQTIRGAVLALVAVMTMFTAFRHRKTPEIAFAAGLVGSILSSPYLHLYDFMLLFAAAWLMLRVVPARFALSPLLVCYLFVLLSTHQGPGARWVLLCECVWLVALLLVPPGLLVPRPAVAGHGQARQL